MRKPSPAHKLIAGAVTMTAVAAAWFFLAPTLLGGSTSYITTEGVSMQPRFHTGDLVLVRARSSYHVGEIAAYHSVLLNTMVMHRIVGQKGGQFVFKGDNNDYVDPELVAPGHVVGAIWMHLPGVAARLAALRQPPVIGGLVGLGALLLVGGAFTRQRRRRRGRRDPDEEHRRHPQPVAIWPTRGRRNDSRIRHPGRPQPQAAPSAQRALHEVDSDDPPSLPRTASWPLRVMIAGVAALAPLLLLAVLAYSKPTHVSAQVTVPYTQNGTFSYSAVTAPGPAYPHGSASTGDPLYIRLVDSLDVRFAYRFHAADAHTISGTASLDARISATTGWKRTVALQPPTHFVGDRLTLSGVLNLAALPRLLKKLESSTEVPSSYTLELVPHVRVSGTVGGFPLHATLSSSLPFVLSALILQPPTPPVGAPGEAPAANPFTPAASGTTAGQRLVPASLQFKVASLHVATARAIASRGLQYVICVLLGCALALGLSRRRERSPSSEVQEIEARYRDWLVPVAHRSRPESSQVVEMADMTALARVAERYERMILHESWEGGDTFSVSEDGVVYQFAVYADGAELLEREPQEEPAAASPVAPTSAPAPGPQSAVTARPALRRVPQPEKRSA